MAQLASSWQQEFGVRLTFRQLLDEHPSLQAVADHIASMLASDSDGDGAQVAPARPDAFDGAGEALPPAGDGRADGSRTELSAERRIPLTDGQKEIWIASQAGVEASCAFNESDFFRIEGPLDADLLASVITQVLDRHEALRMRFDADGEFATIDHGARAEVQRVDLSALEEKAREEALDALIAQAAGAPFDLEHGPTHRCWLVRLAPDVHALVMFFHHLVFDGYSDGVIIREVREAYNSIRKGGEIPRSRAVGYSEFIARKGERRSQAERAMAHWCEVFAVPPAPLELPLDRPRTQSGVMRSFSADTVHQVLPAELMSTLQAVARARKCTLFHLLLAAFQCLLARLSGQNDIVIRIPAAGQAHLGIETVGFCVNALPVRGFADEDKPFSAFLDETRIAMLDAMEHQDVGIGELTHQIRLPRSPDRLPLSDVFFNYSRYFAEADFEGCKIVAHENRRRWTFYDMFLHIEESGGQLIVDWDYSTALFDHETIERWLGHYIELLNGIARNIDDTIADLPLMSAEETAAIIAGWTGSQLAEGER